MFADVWHALEETMNFTYVQNPPADKAWGSKLADGTFDGMIDMVLEMFREFYVTGVF